VGERLMISSHPRPLLITAYKRGHQKYFCPLWARVVRWLASTSQMLRFIWSMAIKIQSY